ncbi:type I restriction endonuclease subunit R [Nocardia jiangxiensis]|uniref:type I restriction endonuclease subunit R n=1 Tax=Nocardia jiangxiensis TaxID=282685 RepID=UPI0002E5A44A|nr:HsdR family type I site-specific deoxyribonuclease [Nocardia jiangxiensis]
MARPEYDEVERPLIDQLLAMGWQQHLEGAPPGTRPQDPTQSGRSDFWTVVLEDRFRQAVNRLNPGPDGQPWLDENRLSLIVELVLRQDLSSVAGNLTVTRLLRSGITVEGLPGWDHGVNQNVRLIDFERPENNDLLVVSQFRVDRPDHRSAIPDLVLFVNGLPLVIIECKRTGPAALDDAVEQVLGYAGAHAAVPVPEFVRFAQVLIGTCGEQAQLGTVTAEAHQFASWRTVEPATVAQVSSEIGKPDWEPISAQGELVAGVLRPAHLLWLVRDFMIDAGSTAKVVGRWQQFRAVQRITDKLKDRRVAITKDVDPDPRGGVVWHTQGSGKSFTMTFLVRSLRATRELTGYKVVVVTDRLDLQTQIHGSLLTTEETPYVANNVDDAREYLARQIADLVMILIQKAQHDDDDTEAEQDAASDEEFGTEPLPDPINLSTRIVVLIDEAHRSQDGLLHARLRALLPNAVMFGFTGTPIIKGRKKRTDEIFGDVIDVYSLKDARDDRSIVPVSYEARLPKFEIVSRALLDAGFDATVTGTRRQRRRAMRQLARKKEVLEAQHVIDYKARDMFSHWASNAMPDGFAAQIVAVSRKAAVRYQAAILAARDDLVTRLRALDTRMRYDPMAAVHATEAEQKLLRILNWRELLASIEVAVVISESAGSADPEDWRTWTRRSDQNQHIRRFKQGFDPNEWFADQPWSATTHAGPIGAPAGSLSAGGDPWDELPSSNQSVQAITASVSPPLAFLVVKSMLLTGFDAPVEQIVYLDRGMGGLELLQAIARTNRPYRNKQYGLIVDYVGVYRDLRRALNDYEREHLRFVIGGDQPPARTVWQGFNESAVPHLQSEHQRLVTFLNNLGVTQLTTSAARSELLARLWDPHLRAQFDELTRDFLSALNAVLPRPQALRYTAFAKQIGEVQYRLRSRDRDDRAEFSPRRYGAKVRALIDEHLRLNQIEQRVPPRDLTTDDYLEKLDNLYDDRARAMEMASALRSRIDLRLPTAVDPDRYERLSERLDRITQSMERDFEQAAAELDSLVREERDAFTSDLSEGLAYFTEKPVRELIERSLRRVAPDVAVPKLDLAIVTRRIVLHLADLAARPNFPENIVVRDRGITLMINYLERELGLHNAEPEALATELVALAARRPNDFRRWSEDGNT